MQNVFHIGGKLTKASEKNNIQVSSSIHDRSIHYRKNESTEVLNYPKSQNIHIKEHKG